MGLQELENSRNSAVAGRYAATRVLVLGALALSPACGETAAPVYPRLSITTTALPNAAPTVAYGATLVAAGGDGSYRWLLMDGALPAGLSLADSTGVISGTPTGSSSTFTVRAASGDGQTATQQLLIYVYDTLAVTTTALPSGATSAAYSETLVAAGGDGTYTWAITGGALPPGLSLVASTGVIAGTPSQTGSDTFTVQVASGDGQSAARQLAITVPPVLQPDELCADYPDYAIATFADPALAAAVRSALSVDEPEDLSCGLVSQLDSLSAEHAGIASLAGMQNLTNLTVLDLGDNAIADISWLSGLTTLISVSLWGNGISDVGALSGLTSLKSLGLSYNVIGDLSALRGLTSLGSLDLSYTTISDLSALRGLTSLAWLALSDNAISDLSPLSGLTNLQTLYLSYNAISDIDALSGLTKLRTLVLLRNAISDISALSGLTSLQYLSLSFNAVSDLSALSGLMSLVQLDLPGNSISDIDALSGLTNLKYLRLNRNAISDISPLRGLTNLYHLYLNDNSTLADIQPLLDNTGFAAGDWVDLGGTSVSCADVAALRAKGVDVESDCP